MPTKKKLIEPEITSGVQIPKELKVRGDAIVVSDLHAETVKWSLVEQVCVTAQQYDIHTLCVVGDFFSFDMLSGFSQFTPSNPMGVELRAVRKMFNRWMEVFNMTYACRGNHDQRLSVKLMGQADMAMLGDLIMPNGNRQRLVMTDKDRMWLYSGRQKWLLCHPGKEYSRNGLVAAAKLALKFQCNVLAGHQHHGNQGTDPYGRYCVIDNPCMSRTEKTAYTSLNTNSMPNWILGFTVIKNGHADVYYDGLPMGIK